MSIVVRPYQSGDEASIISLIVGIQQQEFGIAITADDQPDLKNIETFYRQGVGNFWVACDNDRVVGTISLLDIGKSEVALRKMFVDVAYRGKQKGVAQALLNEALAWSAKKNVRAIFLGTTTKFLAAHRFYEKNGFREIEKEELPRNFPIMKVDSRFFERVL